MIGGLAVLIVGAIFLLNQLDWLDIGDAWAYWPVMLIAFGIAKLAYRRSSSAKDSRIVILKDGTRLPTTRAGYEKLRKLL